jgi:hypothetical protein
MPALLRDDILEKLERSRTYLIADIVFNWIGGIGELLLTLYIVWLLWTDPPRINRRLWLEVFLLSIGLLSIRRIKNEVLAWAGVAPPDHNRWFGPKQEESVLTEMKPILDAQQRAERIRGRGIRVEEMLEENKAKFERHHRPTLD